MNLVSHKMAPCCPGRVDFSEAEMMRTTCGGPSRGLNRWTLALDFEISTGAG